VTVCGKVTSPSVGFTHECVIEFKEKSSGGVYQLAIGETNSDGGIVNPIVYTIGLPQVSKIESAK
jgi:hypothetical protein